MHNGSVRANFIQVCFLLLVVMGLSSPLPAQDKGQVAGQWDVTVSAAAGERQVVITIKKEGEKLLGFLTTQRGDIPFETVTLQGDDISLILKVPIEGQETTISLRGKVSENSMKGEGDFGPYGKGTWSGTKRVETPSAASGATFTGSWKFEFETPNGTRLADFNLKQEGDKLSGTAKSEAGETTITGSVQGNEMTLLFQVPEGGEAYKIQCKGKLENSQQMKGTFTYNDMGPGSWTAKRQVTAAAPTPLSGTWRFEFETPDGSKVANVTLSQENQAIKGKANYESQEVPVTGTIQEKAVVLSFQVQYQGESLKVQCKGKLESDTSMSGAFTYNEMGPLNWTAKKK